MSQPLTVSTVAAGTHAWLTEWKATVGVLVADQGPRETEYMVYDRYIRSEFLGGYHATPTLYEALAGRPLHEPNDGRYILDVTSTDDPVCRALIGGDLYITVVNVDGEQESDVRASTAAEAMEALETLERLAREPRAAEWSELVRRQVDAYIAFYRALRPGEEVVYRM